MDTDIVIASHNPQFPNIREIGASLYTPTVCISRQIVVIVHGHAGHRDYCYQRALAEKLDQVSIRFDFSGCGYQLGSGTPPGDETKEIPRTIESDMTDLSTVISWCREQKYIVTALVGHSRGGVACLQYAKRDASIPTVVNCSGRYRAHLILEKVKKNPALKPGMLGFWETQRAGTGGALVKKWTLLSEIQSVGKQEMAGIKDALPSSTDVLLVFGTRDIIVPVSDSAMFIEELKERCTLHLEEDADHNFFIQPDARYPQRVNRNPAVAEAIAKYLSEDATRARFLRREAFVPEPRFKKVEGVPNFRDLGGYANFPLGLVYRSADLSDVTQLGMHQLSNHVSLIIDVRSHPEAISNGIVGKAGPDASSVPFEKLGEEASAQLQPYGVRRLHIPVFEKIDYSPKGLASFFGDGKATVAQREQGMLKAYKSIALNAAGVLQKLIPILADVIRSRARLLKSGEDGTVVDRRGILLHCSAGKDRTGIICALLLALAQVDDEIICREYELTTYGLTLNGAPAGGESAEDKVAKAVPAGAALHLQPDTQNIGSGSRSETMRKTLVLIREQLGGIETYFQERVKTSRQDLELVTAVLRGKEPFMLVQQIPGAIAVKREN
ncbi:protein-tyrosine phosphatase-like protein [Protomyces lactucae-debilis]|uniref:Protein-tyrosine phosphatase-like protein n=1 Tax=Protomyces lactucae-debilis TaxID=2754530 RepID=A0A1Y2FFV0_PROLT|nr:protein-tyrosine phosphatase-like protein [Protomyces lactucae-debilis]ORY82487.1 protein-tyrosine phosphatase-like protein [Protomyces lactucae-debilis]